MAVATHSLLHLSGILALIGSALFALGDVLLLAPHVGLVNPVSSNALDLSAYPALQRRADRWRVLAGMPWGRLVWGGLVGVFAAPLTLAGIWQVYQGLQSAGLWLAVPPMLLLTYATAIGPFIHGSFIYLGATVQTIKALEGPQHETLIQVLLRQQAVLLIAYAVLFVCAISGSLWFTVAVLSGRTLFPIWMAAFNPVTLTLLWLASKRILPKRVTDWTEGAGFNMAYLLFFALTTVLLW